MGRCSRWGDQVKCNWVVWACQVETVHGWASDFGRSNEGKKEIRSDSKVQRVNQGTMSDSDRNGAEEKEQFGGAAYKIPISFCASVTPQKGAGGVRETLPPSRASVAFFLTQGLPTLQGKNFFYHKQNFD